MLTHHLTRRRFVAASLAGGASLVTATPAPALAQTPIASDQRLAITDVTVIDATGAPPLAHATVVIRGNRIEEIRSGTPGHDTDGMRVVAGAGKYLIPGLWDAHVHTFVFPWQPEVSLPLFLANGVTSIRDMGGALPVSDASSQGAGFPMSAIEETASRIASGERSGPRVVAGTMVDGPAPVWPIALAAGTAAEGEQAVAAIAGAGANFVKVYTLLPRDAFAAIAEAAKARSLPFLGHVPIASTPADGAALGMRTIEHYSDSLLPYASSDEEALLAELRAVASGPDPVQAYAATFFSRLPQMVETFDAGKVEAMAERFAANQTGFTPTLIIGRNAARASDPAHATDPHLRYLPPEVVAGWQAAAGPNVDPGLAQRSLEIGATMTRIMQEAGVPILAGTDVGLPNLVPGFSLHDELALLVEAGLSPLEALQAATRNPAVAMGLGDDLGAIEPGKLADLVLLDANPLDAIANTTRIAAVIANGRLLERPDLDALLQHTAQPAASPGASPTP
jgi:imidazolonepropionase-like amidohydrolase